MEISNVNPTEVSESGGLSAGRGITILNASHVEEFLWYWSADNTCASWCWYEPHFDTTTISSDLAGNGVWLADLVSPVSQSDWNEGKFGQSYGTANGCGYLF